MPVVPNVHGPSYADGFVGEKYKPYRSTTDTAKLIRADIKAAVKAGDLPGTVRYSVRTAYFSGGSSIHISVKDAIVRRVVEEHQPWNGLVYSHEAGVLLGQLESIMSQYQRDMSDSMVDYFEVDFYQHAAYDWETTTYLDPEGVTQ